MAYILPVVLVIASNTLYQICAKSIPEGVNPFAALIITYLVGAVISAGIYFATASNGSLVEEFSNMNWAPYILGVIIVGLEVGVIYAYKVGWAVSMLQMVQCSILAVVLIGVGYFLYHEAITWNKVVGIIICLIGLGFINK